jgi:hypothetical protein
VKILEEIDLLVVDRRRGSNGEPKRMTGDRGGAAAAKRGPCSGDHLSGRHGRDGRGRVDAAGGAIVDALAGY